MIPPEDTHSRTVADAAAFERRRALDAAYDDEADQCFDDPGLGAETWEETADEIWEHDDERPCCSDFSCPCGG